MLTNTTTFPSQTIDTAMDSVTNISAQDLPTTSTTTLSALATAVNNHMRSS